MDLDISRRKLIAAAPLAASLLASAPAFAAPAPRPRTVLSPEEVAERLRDPAIRARVQARVRGSCAAETVPVFYRLHIYGFLGDGNLVPFFTMNHLSVNEWRPLANNEYEARTFECGAYCKFGTDEPLEVWTNPVTGEQRKVWQFLGGPFTVTTGPDGIKASGAELTPKPAVMEAVGDTFFLNASADMAIPNPIPKDKYPKLWAGPMSYWDTMSSVMCTTADAFDDSLSQAPAVTQFQNMAAWHPWLGMGSHPGRTVGRAIGAKLASFDEIPAPARASLEKLTPQIFDREGWTKPRMDIPEYLRSLSG
ncbi:DUF1838 family protein [Novosphingobium profundi]|uniref:DUF1838 family protein n=1 Tax=Novosphingobium profundi TaxID=1774954 RepID=UPI001BD9F0E9|nr:DUF1838 family protein [Novosphingobium profundi]MBT0671024.1 DUF1838 family protein [Novosphingobium profundi]